MNEETSNSTPAEEFNLFTARWYVRYPLSVTAFVVAGGAFYLLDGEPAWMRLGLAGLAVINGIALAWELSLVALSCLVLWWIFKDLGKNEWRDWPGLGLILIFIYHTYRIDKLRDSLRVLEAELSNLRTSVNRGA